MSCRAVARYVFSALRGQTTAPAISNHRFEALNSLFDSSASAVTSAFRGLHMSSVTPKVRTRAVSLSDFHRGVQGTRGGRTGLEMGLVGEREWEWGFTGQFADQMPNYELLQKEFGGTKYKDLPICHIKASRNNTIILFSDAQGEIITATSCRAEGFKNARKKTTVAGQATGVAAGLRALRRGITHVKVRGLGPGRVSSVHGLALSGLQVVSITDFTPIVEVGPRPKKQRRL